MMNTNKRVSTCGCYRNSHLLAKPVLLFTLYVSRNLCCHLTEIQVFSSQKMQLNRFPTIFVVSNWTIGRHFVTQSEKLAERGSPIFPASCVADSRAMHSKGSFIDTKQDWKKMVSFTTMTFLSSKLIVRWKMLSRLQSAFTVTRTRHCTWP